MSIMSGLVETGSPHSAAPDESILGQWFVRHAWSVVIAASIGFWVVVSAAFLWG